MTSVKKALSGTGSRRRFVVVTGVYPGLLDPAASPIFSTPPVESISLLERVRSRMVQLLRAFLSVEQIGTRIPRQTPLGYRLSISHRLSVSGRWWFRYFERFFLSNILAPAFRAKHR